MASPPPAKSGSKAARKPEELVGSAVLTFSPRTPNADKALRFSRQAACWEKVDGDNTNKMVSLEEKIIKKEKKYDSWVKEMRRTEKERQFEIKAN